MLPEAKPRGTSRVIGNSSFIILFVMLNAGWHTNFPRFQGARPDHVRVESSSCCFPMKFMRFVRPRELASFEEQHVTRPPPVGKRMSVWRYNKIDLF